MILRSAPTLRGAHNPPMRLLVAASIALLSFSAFANPDVTLYLENCSGCHTIGEGDLAGPDLLPSTKWPRADLRAAVQRMEANVGPMTPEQVDAITDLLQSPDLKSLLYAATMGEKARPKGSATTGERLYFGQDPLANGGSPCFACHSVRGRGGSLAVDLTTVHARMGDSALLSATEQAAFPLMRGLYAKRPVTSDEASHLVAFLETCAVGVPPDAKPPAESASKVHGAAGGIAVAVFGAVAILFRSRRAGVRERMVRKSGRSS